MVTSSKQPKILNEKPIDGLWRIKQMYFDTVVIAALTIVTATLAVSAFGVTFLVTRINKETAKINVKK